ncbi:MAG: DUF177 domain-containing protein, partial [Anaerolineae bacterium]|nr:DUF177 domain-containing protein [Anaerolineae bacterium]
NLDECFELCYNCNVGGRSEVPAMIKVNLSSLIHTEVGHRQTATIHYGNLAISDLHLGHLKGTLHFTRIASGVLCEGALETQVTVECTRCLKQFFEPIHIELEDVLSLPAAELTPERPVRVSESGWVDLTPLVREYVWLNIPVKPLCSPDCRGICPDCGGDIAAGECTCDRSTTVDPRWEALRTLLAGENEGAEH